MTNSTTPPNDVPDARRISRDALREAEQVSGAQVVVIEGPNLPTLSAIRFARGSAPAHVIEYRSDHAWAVDYLVVFQCGMLRRRLDAISSGPVDLRPSPEGFKDVKAALAKSVAGKLNPSSANQLATQLLEGLVVHLRSVPLALAVDSAIETELEVLQETQRRVLTEQLRENEQSLDIAVAGLLPHRIVDATCAISSALALFWAERWAHPGLSAPYQYSGHAETGSRLLDIWQENRSAGALDHKVIDGWADQLGIADWYSWLGNDDRSGESEG